MIRNVVVGRVREGVPAEQVEAAIQALRDLTVEGVEFRLVGGQDRGLREGNASFALTADFVSDEAYRTLRRRSGAQPHPPGALRADLVVDRADPVRAAGVIRSVSGVAPQTLSVRNATHSRSLAGKSVALTRLNALTCAP